MTPSVVLGWQLVTWSAVLSLVCISTGCAPLPGHESAQLRALACKSHADAAYQRAVDRCVERCSSPELDTLAAEACWMQCEGPAATRLIEHYARCNGG